MSDKSLCPQEIQSVGHLFGHNNLWHTFGQATNWNTWPHPQWTEWNEEESSCVVLFYLGLLPASAHVYIKSSIPHQFLSDEMPSACKTEKRWNFVSHHFHIISAHMDLIEFIYGMAYEVFTHFLFTRSFHSCTQIMWILISIEWQTNNVFCHANKNIENVAFYLPHFAIRYSYPCSSQCIK